MLSPARSSRYVSWSYWIVDVDALHVVLWGSVVVVVVAVAVEVGDVGDGDVRLEEGWAKFGWTRGLSIFLSLP